MVKTIKATFDGKVFLPDNLPAIKPYTRVRLVVETVQPVKKETSSFLKTARSLNLDGPSDWSSNLENYLYGKP
ncbi:MAG: hypothetical protein GY795_48275 [Desulfobacterales bacterium]|nr:hypothetical protein [Desulfobacterales bacterium]